jgi:putative membrane protein
MSHSTFRLTKLCTALAALGLAAAVSAQDSTTGSGAYAPKTKDATPSTQSSKQDSALPSTDKKFVEKAATGGMLEVQLGQLAQQKASSEQVKQFAAKMAEDHAKANDELKQIASAKGAQVPAALDKSEQKEIQKLEKLSGSDFDREYMKRMVSDHKDDVSAFEKEAKSGKDAELKSFAQKTLPTLQEHMKLAQTTYDSIKESRKSATKPADTTAPGKPSATN